MKKLLFIPLLVLSFLYCTPITFADEASISNCDQLINAINSSEPGSCICLDDDIILDQNLFVPKSITLNLNQHKIIIPENYFITCGKKVLDHMEYSLIKHPGYWYYDHELIIHNGKHYTNFKGKKTAQPSWSETRIKRKWHEPWFENKEQPVYEYIDDIEITIKNGFITKDSGQNGIDLLNNKTVFPRKPSTVNNGTAACPNFSILVISGTLNIKNMTIYGGDGGNGGNGAYTKEIHCFFSGSGNDGGRGGNGADIIHTENKCKVYINDSQLTPGLGGKGGCGGSPNPNYWLWSGLKGKNGSDGQNGSVIDDISKLYYR